MAPIGIVTTSFSLDKTEYQGSEPVTGTAFVRFRPTTNTSNATTPDLFGPLKLCVVLKGQLTISVSENRTSHAHIFYNEKRSLLVKSEEVINGSFRAAANETQRFSFQIHFPALTDQFNGQKDLLPPTFYARYTVQPAKQLGKHHGSALIEYDVRVEAEMPGIEVTISNETAPVKVQYQPPAEPSMSSKPEFTQTVELQSYALLQEHERPSLLERTKARMKGAPMPSYAFDVACTGFPDAIPVGGDLQLNLRVRPGSKDTVVIGTPEIALGDCRVDIIARTQLYATNNRGGDSARIDGSEVEASLRLTQQRPEGAFTKENDFTKTLFFESVPRNVPSTFLIRKLGRSYKLRFDLQFLVSGEKVGLTRSVNVRILPKPAQRTAMRESVAGPSVYRAGSRSSESEDLPKYHEIGHSAPPFQHL